MSILDKKEFAVFYIITIFGEKLSGTSSLHKLYNLASRKISLNRGELKISVKHPKYAVDTGLSGMAISVDMALYSKVLIDIYLAHVGIGSG